MMTMTLREVDGVEVLTLQDNYIDIAAFDGTAVVQRATSVKNMELKNSILAEHGYSAVVTLREGDRSSSVLFDFGFSENGASLNADALGADLTTIEAMALSHGHMDHFGGLVPLAKKTGKAGLELFLHPTAFRKPRYVKLPGDLRLNLPPLNRERLEEARVNVVETTSPRPLLDGALVFLGEIPRRTAFEKGSPRMFYENDGEEEWDPIEDDTAIVANVKGKGLVILSGCAHSGIVNTARYATEVTGVDRVFAVMGGFHLTGRDFETTIGPTVDALKALNPTYIVPTHCTGRSAVMRIEKEMPDKFLLNMSGTKMVFSS
ncbi:MAG: MBL fold metallo-hydrolase [Candidatus Latescibacterota bacterium]|jgi:7,8-dihydropterin-6-yl-methyl-4-(beta-D-ribofuranosyl)aminobenzene 5'-phosphate synthase